MASFFVRDKLCRTGKILLGTIGYNMVMERCYTSKLELPKQIKDDFTISDCFKAGIGEELIDRTPLLSSQNLVKYGTSLFILVNSLMLTFISLPSNRLEKGEGRKLIICQQQSPYINIIRAIYGFSIISGFTHLFLNNPITRKIMIGVTTVSFGVSHVHNFTEINKNVMKLVVLHQTISGAILAYVAMQIGLRYAMAMHIVYDLVCYGKQVYEKRPIRSSTFFDVI